MSKEPIDPKDVPPVKLATSEHGEFSEGKDDGPGDADTAEFTYETHEEHDS